MDQQQHQELSLADSLNLLEKRCLVYMKLKQYDKVVYDGQALLQLKSNHPLAFRCLLAALAKMNQLEKVAEVLKVWQAATPNNLEMIECRTKLAGLIEAVNRGIDSRSAFSNVEELLGLNYEWLLRRRTHDTQWQYRPLPPGRNSFVLCLQYRFGHCSLGQKCSDAHGEQELEEWKNRSIAENAEVEQYTNSVISTPYIQKLVNLISAAGDETLVLSSEDNNLSGIKIRCMEPLSVTLSSRKKRKYSWKFGVESKQPLLHACLLHETHRQYFYINSAFFHGPGSKMDLRPSMSEHIQVLDVNLDPEVTSNKNHYIYSLEVVFSPELMGNFRQSVVFDFGIEPKCVRNISAEVCPPSDDDAADSDKMGNDSSISASPTDETMPHVTRTKATWNYGNADIVNGSNGSRVSSDKVGFALINGLPKVNVIDDSKEDLTRENYKDRMRFFLTEEERARQEIISKYNVSAVLKICDQYSLITECKYAVDGSLFGRMTLFRDVSEDTAVGRLILRSCNCVLLTKTDDVNKASGSKPRVYWCEISDKTKNAIYIQLGGNAVRELGLKNHDLLLFDIQFQLDRSAFMEQKKVIDRLNQIHLDMLFPEFNNSPTIPWSPSLQWQWDEGSVHLRLNPKQKESLIAVTAEALEGSTGPPVPILLIGPFGTGKTFTLAQCIRKILMQPGTRIMICTQSNSAADLYIKEYLDSWCINGLEAARPLRIYYALRSFKTVHQNVLKYCMKENGRFKNPSKEDILSHRVIVVTLSTSYLLLDLDLPPDTFSHIFLDEAAQAMESEAITPLYSAGKNTKLVLAGDHMQLSPELFVNATLRKKFHSSLLERLHYLYPDSHPCKLMLCENYRSHSAIIKFASKFFYHGKLECGMSQPSHEKVYPLSFFAARGEDVQDPDSTSYFNMAEVYEITEKVREIISSWPEEWGDFRDECAIGVLTPYADQVAKIRARLRKMGLTHVSVERVLNVQGKQFRVVFLSTVRTHKPWVRILPEAVGKEVDLGFFSNSKLLNTALTRAQSLVAVVGDPVSLCSVGKCRTLWEEFIKVCHENRALHGISYTQLKQSILGAELRLTWGLNPLAIEFEPKSTNVISNSANTSAQLTSFSAVTTTAPPTTTFSRADVKTYSNMCNSPHLPVPSVAPVPAVQAVIPGSEIPYAGYAASMPAAAFAPQLLNSHPGPQASPYPLPPNAQHAWRSYLPLPVQPVVRAYGGHGTPYADYAGAPVGSLYGIVRPTIATNPYVNVPTIVPVPSPAPVPRQIPLQQPYGQYMNPIRSNIDPPIPPPMPFTVMRTSEGSKPAVMLQEQLNNNYATNCHVIRPMHSAADIARYQAGFNLRAGLPLYKRSMEVPPNLNPQSNLGNYGNQYQDYQAARQGPGAQMGNVANIDVGSGNNMENDSKSEILAVQSRMLEMLEMYAAAGTGNPNIMQDEKMIQLSQKLAYLKMTNGAGGGVSSHNNDHSSNSSSEQQLNYPSSRRQVPPMVDNRVVSSGVSMAPSQCHPNNSWAAPSMRDVKIKDGHGPVHLFNRHGMGDPNVCELRNGVDGSLNSNSLPSTRDSSERGPTHGDNFSTRSYANVVKQSSNKVISNNNSCPTSAEQSSQHQQQQQQYVALFLKGNHKNSHSPMNQAQKMSGVQQTDNPIENSPYGLWYRNNP